MKDNNIAKEIEVKKLELALRKNRRILVFLDLHNFL